MSDQAECLGMMFLSFQKICHAMQLNLGPDLDKICDGLALDAWYPLSLYRRLLGLVATAYPTPGPVFERVGIETSKHVAGENGPDYLHLRAADFLRFNVAVYAQVTRGPVDEVGVLEIVSMNEAEGRATIHSTSCIPRDLERGFYIGGLEMVPDIGFINVVTDHAAGLHHVEFH